MGWWDSHGTSLDRRGELTDAIRKVLDPLQPPDPFLSVEYAELFDLPGLEVDGVGPIGLPISPNDARALIGAGRPRADVKTTKTTCKAHAPKSWDLMRINSSLRIPAGQVVYVYGSARRFPTWS